jgi:flavin-dependent dehydrogenase
MGAVLQEDNLLQKVEDEAVRGGVVVWHSASGERIRRISTGGFHLMVRHEGIDKSVVAFKNVLLFEGYQAKLAQQLGMSTGLRPDQFYRGYEQTVEPTDQPRGEVRMWLPDPAETVPRAAYHWDFPASFVGKPARRVGNASARSDAHTASWYFDRWWKVHGSEYGTRVLSRCGGIIPTAPPARRLYDHGAFLGGDAAALCCSITGGGILGALESGVQAAAAIVGGDPKSYPARVRWLTKELRLRYALKMLVTRLSYDELDTLVEMMGEFPVARGSDLDPIRQRKAFSRWAVRTHPRLFSTLLTRGRFWEAVGPFL